MRHKFRKLPVGRTKRHDDAENRLDYEFSKRMIAVQRKHGDCHEEDPDSGVVYVGNIPHGFYEVQMYRYFTQFGRIKRLRLSRSKKSGRSKGFAYIEFEFTEVAKAAAETMNNYLFMRKMLKCEVVPKEKLHADTFRGCFRPFPKPVGRKESIKRNNAYLEADPVKVCKNLRRRAKQEMKKEKLLEEMGVDYKIDAYKTEWTAVQDKMENANKVFDLQNWEKDSGDQDEDGSTDEVSLGETDLIEDDKTVESPSPRSRRKKRKSADTQDRAKSTRSRKSSTSENDTPQTETKRQRPAKPMDKEDIPVSPKPTKSRTAKSTGKKSLAGRKLRSAKSRQSM